MAEGGSAKEMDAVEVVFDGSAGKLVQTFTNVGRGLSRMIQNLKVGQVAMAAFVVGVAAATFVAARRAVAAAATIDAALREVGTLLGETGEGMNFLRKQILALSTNVPAPPEVLTRGLYQVVSAGITDTADALNVLRVSARAAVAGLTDTFTAVDAITTVLNAFELDASEATRVANVLFATVREGKVTFPELAASIGNVATSAGIGRASIEELGGAIATLTKFGLSSNKATTALNSLLISMINPVDKVQEAAFELGIEWNAAALEAKGLSGVMQELAEVADGNAQVVARLVPQIRSYRAGAVLAGRGNQEFNRITLELIQSQGVLSEAFNTVNGSLDNQKTLLANNVNKLWAELGFRILPAITDILGDVNRALTDPRLQLAQILEDAGNLQTAFELRKVVALEDVNEALIVTQERAEKAFGSLKAFIELLNEGPKTGRGSAQNQADALLPAYVTENIQKAKGSLSAILKEQPALLRPLNKLWEDLDKNVGNYEAQLLILQTFMKTTAPILTESLRDALGNEAFQTVSRTLGNFIADAQAAERAINSLVNQEQLRLDLQEATLLKLQEEATARNKLFKTDFDYLRERLTKEEGILEALEARTGASESELEHQRLRVELADVELKLLTAQQEQKQKGLDKEEEINALFKRRAQIIQEIGQSARAELADITQELALLAGGGVDERALAGLQERQQYLKEEVVLLNAIETFGLESLKTQRLIALVEQARLDRAAERRELLAQDREDEEAILAAVVAAANARGEIGTGVIGKPTAPFGLDPSAPDTLARITQELGPMLEMVEDAQEELDEWRKISSALGLELEHFITLMSLLDKDFGAYIAALKAIADGTDTWRDRMIVITATVAQSARSVLQFGQAIGALGDDAARTLGAIIELTQGVSQLITSTEGLGSLGNIVNIASVVGAGLNLLGSIFGGGGGDEEAKRIAEESRKEAIALRETLETNNQRLIDLSFSLSEFANAIIGFSGDFISGIRDALTLADVDAQIQEILQKIAEARAGGAQIPGFVLPLGQIFSEVRNDILQSLRDSGLTIQDVERAASSLGIEVGELINFLNGAAQSTAEVNAAMEEAVQLQEALADRGLDTAFEGFGGQLDLLQLKFELFDITNPIKQLEMIQEVLRDVGNIDLDNIEDDKVREALATLLTGDLTTPEGQKAMDDAIRTIYEAIASGALTFGDLGGLTLPQLTDLLQTFEGTLDDLIGTASDGSENVSAINRITTEQADRLLSYAATRNHYLEEIRNSVQGAFGTGLSAPTNDQMAAFAGGGIVNNIDELNITVNEANTPLETLTAISDQLDAELGSSLIAARSGGGGFAYRRNV